MVRWVFLVVDPGVASLIWLTCRYGTGHADGGWCYAVTVTWHSQFAPSQRQLEPNKVCMARKIILCVILWQLSPSNRGRGERMKKQNKRDEERITLSLMRNATLLSALCLRVPSCVQFSMSLFYPCRIFRTLRVPHTHTQSSHLFFHVKALNRAQWFYWNFIFLSSLSHCPPPSDGSLDPLCTHFVFILWRVESVSSHCHMFRAVILCAQIACVFGEL